MIGLSITGALFDVSGDKRSQAYWTHQALISSQTLFLKNRFSSYWIPRKSLPIAIARVSSDSAERKHSRNTRETLETAASALFDPHTVGQPERWDSIRDVQQTAVFDDNVFYNVWKQISGKASDYRRALNQPSQRAPTSKLLSPTSVKQSKLVW